MKIARGAGRQRASLKSLSDASLRELCDRLEQQIVGGRASLDEYGYLAQARAERLRRSSTR